MSQSMANKAPFAEPKKWQRTPTSRMDHITAYPDRRMEVHLKGLPQTWVFLLQRGCKKEEQKK